VSGNRESFNSMFNDYPNLRSMVCRKKTEPLAWLSAVAAVWLFVGCDPSFCQRTVYAAEGFGEGNPTQQSPSQQVEAEQQAAAATQEPPPSSSSPSASSPVSEFPDLRIPADATREKLTEIVAAAKAARPATVEQYEAQQTAIRDASKQLLKLVSPEDASYAQVELDSIIASVSLLAFFGEDEQADIVDQLTEFLGSRDQLSMQDVQTGILAAGMIELQPDKQPAKELYELLDGRLADDPREEMQSLRLNLQASVRRLNLLGNRLELEAMTVDGKKISITDLAGKFVIVDFFATWCAPCLAEAELIESHYGRYRDKGLEVVGISLDEDAQDLQDYLDKKQLPWPIIHDADPDPMQRLSMKYGILALPTVLLLNKEGTVVSLEARQTELNRLMQMIFEAPTPAADLEQVEEEIETPGE
jgi:peroxiredoxin